MAISSVNIKQIQLGDTEYELSARKILTADNAEKSWEDILELIDQSFEVVISTEASNTPNIAQWKRGTVLITGTLAPSDSLKNNIYLVPQEDVSAGSYVEYIVAGTPAAWEKIGSTTVDLEGYVKKDTYTSEVEGLHTHTATVQVDSYKAPTKKKLGINKTQDVTLTPTDADFITALNEPTTDSVIGADATIAVSDSGASKQKLVTASVIPAKANGQASKVTVTPNVGAASKVAVNSGAKTVAKVDGSITAADGTLASSTASAANALMASATVTGGVLSFGYKTLNTTSIPNAVAENIDTYSITDVDVPTVTATDVDVATVDTAVTCATGALATDGTGSQVVTEVGTITAAFDNKDLATVVTGYAPTTSKAVTAVAVSNQPDFALDGAAASGIDYIDDIIVGERKTETVTVENNGEHAHEIDLES